MNNWYDREYAALDRQRGLLWEAEVRRMTREMPRSRGTAWPARALAALATIALRAAPGLVRHPTAPRARQSALRRSAGAVDP